MKHLHVINEWESECSKKGFEIEEVLFNSKREVTKVLGWIDNGRGGKTPVHWDGQGICYVAKIKRYKLGDIHFG